MTLFKHSHFYFILMLLVSIEVSRCDDEENICGTLYSAPKSQGISFSLKDQDIYSDLSEDDRIFESGWGVTGSISVEAGCKMKVCTETYLDSGCHIIEHGSHSINENGFMAGLSSAQCVCQKECRCEDVHIKMPICGRAYFEDGCRTCNALYTELIVGKRGNLIRGNMTAIRLRKGCMISIYPEENFKGEDMLTDVETIEDFQDKIGSYECECYDTDYEAPTRPPRPSSYPELVHIPDSMNDLLKLLRNSTFKHHLGLNAAQVSYTNGRSHKNTYILVLGSRVSGKSSLINLLLDKPNAMQIFDGSSETDGIQEIRVPAAIDALGIANSELRIIEVPGIGDQRGLEHDAKVLATLDEYLTNHSELRNRIPNAVLILNQFNDREFDERNSKFIKMIRGFGNFSKKITDDKYSNVIFVLTHLCTEGRLTSRKPGSRIQQFKKVIQDQNVFPSSIHIVVAENEARDHDLKMVNGNFKLTNNELYPANVIEKMTFGAQKAGDLIGLEMFKSVFGNLENANVTSLPLYPLVERREKMLEYLALLTATKDSGGSGRTEQALVARIETLEASLAKERIERVKDIERFKHIFVIAQQKALASQRYNIQQDLEKVKQEIWDKIKVDLNKLFE